MVAYEEKTSLFKNKSIAKNCTMIPQAEFHTKTAIKLLRLHNETIEALCRYRRKGEQRVVVQHVNVVGNMECVLKKRLLKGESSLNSFANVEDCYIKYIFMLMLPPPHSNNDFSRPMMGCFCMHGSTIVYNH